MFICIAFGALVIINYFYILDYRLLYISAGIGMLFSGITDMVSNLYLAYAKTKYEKGHESDGHEPGLESGHESDEE